MVREGHKSWGEGLFVQCWYDGWVNPSSLPSLCHRGWLRLRLEGCNASSFNRCNPSFHLTHFDPLFFVEFSSIHCLDLVASEITLRVAVFSIYLDFLDLIIFVVVTAILHSNFYILIYIQILSQCYL